ncbi:MAG TPA: protein kinase [Thermoanaerobaculia bacterium]|nr:protein kinase [Thermoanaerobaculia bacterium]
MKLEKGVHLGPYEILAPIGAGGMGEVFRARDARLGREVAIKILPESLADNPRALARFEREARAVAALSHPNILAIHDFGRESGLAFAVMELLEGESLDRRLAREELPWKKALEIGAAVADGLASAHARGIVHRDLKPANVFLTREGIVKILDFGLARQDEVSGAEETARPTVLAPATEPGAVLGTVGYMSPEQVRGEPADARSDIFSLGCVLYEMLTGRRAFREKAAAETLASILRDHPKEVSESVRSVPSGVDGVVRRCLEKSPDERFQSARDLAFALREILGSATAPTGVREIPAPMPTHRRRWIGAVVTLVLAVAAILVLDPGGLRGRLFRGGATRTRSLAVLPFANLSGDPGQEYFADGLTEELITRISKLGSLRVTSRTSIMGYKQTKKRIPDIARELGVDTLIEGSVAREGDRVKVTAQLIDGSSDRHIWANSYERDLKEILALEGEVAQAVAREIGEKLTPSAEAGLAAAMRPVIPAAYDAYVRGRHAWNKRGEASLREGIRLFQESIDADPTYAPAYAGMADCYAQLGYASIVSPDDSFPRAKAAAQKALELDPNLAEAHASLGFARMYYDWDFAGAEREYRRAIELNRNSATAHQWYAYLLTAMERPQPEAAREIATAKSLDPLSVPIHTDQAYILYYYGDVGGALKSVRTALEMNPKFPLGHFWLVRIYTSQGKYAEAEAEIGQIGELRTWTPAMAAAGFLYGLLGRRKEAEEILKEFADLNRQGKYASSYAIAVVDAGLGEKERALVHLEDAYRERSHWLVWLKRDPRWDSVRTDPRFVQLVRKVGLPA